ncbi:MULTISPECIES: hypothetical protein [Micrococcaceae]|uniref:hypothetical protein n=1 Tax=Micrococcaceae TaxID=1268 RepID=UPI0012F8A9E0|nr:hypothetical protein [Pseudarthrobacter sp. GA104]MUU71486.1 hypothetical protein [Pseudarthrobacter sp. GA104]
MLTALDEPARSRISRYRRPAKVRLLGYLRKYESDAGIGSVIGRMLLFTPFVN